LKEHPAPSFRRVLEETPPHYAVEENLSRKPEARESADGFPFSLRALRAGCLADCFAFGSQ
jgi:hypothetical protein